MCCPASAVAQLVRNGAAEAALQLTCASLVQSNFRPGVQLARTARSLRRMSVCSGISVSPSFAYFQTKSMGAPDTFGINMCLRYAGGEKLRRSGEAYFQAYLVLWVRRIDMTAHIYTYAA